MDKIAFGFVAAGANLILFDDDEYDFGANEEIQRRNYILNFVEITVSRYSLDEFKSHFRMKRTTFERISHLLQNTYLEATRPEISMEKQLMVTLWYLANPECFRTVSSRFNLSISSCFKIMYRTCRRLMKINIANRIICWPSEQEQNNISMNFKFPRAIGCIDGCHIQIAKPQDNQSSYINRKGFHSMVLQGIFNSQKEFIDFYFGEVGSVHDATIFRRSNVYNSIMNGSKSISSNHYLLGDSAYPLLPFLMKPYRDNGNLTYAQKKFNKKLSSSRVKIEHTFGLLKARFRKLKLLEQRKPDFIALIVASCCILHNICQKQNDFIELEPEDLEEIRANSISYQNDLNDRAAINTRNQICSSL